jgi:hypothetical protein
MALGRKTGGRRKGIPNKITRSFKEAVQTAYQAIGGDEAFATWARENQSDFYKIAARLIPAETANPISAFGEGGITIIIGSVESPRVIDQSPAMNCIER